MYFLNILPQLFYTNCWECSLSAKKKIGHKSMVDLRGGDKWIAPLEISAILISILCSRNRCFIYIITINLMIPVVNFYHVL